jgi:hypothetical protein
MALLQLIAATGATMAEIADSLGYDHKSDFK